MDELLKGTTVTIETAFSPPITFDLAEEANAPTGALTKLLKPKVTIRKEGFSKPLAIIAPAGDPSGGRGAVLVLVVVAIAVVALLASR